MDNKVKVEEIQNKIDSLSLEFKVIEYNGYGKKSKFQHSCVYLFPVLLNYLTKKLKMI